MVKYGTDKADRTAFTKNLSETGLFIGTNNVFKPGTTIQVELKFPDHTFSMWARVIWAKKVPSQLAHVVEPALLAGTLLRAAGREDPQPVGEPDGHRRRGQRQRKEQSRHQ